MVLLPFQSVWAAAAPYCAHESAPQAAAHFGHHVHQHAGSAADASVAGGYHADCDACNLGVSVPLPPSGLPAAAPPRTVAYVEPASGFRSHIPSVPKPPARS